MVLPTTGNAISFNDIRIELGVGGASPFDIANASSDYYALIQHCSAPWPDSGSTQGANPDSISEWWSYDHSKTGSLYAQADYSSTSCAEVCTSTPFVTCLNTVYDYSSKYYNDTICRSPATGYYVPPTNCSGGTKYGQPCYYFSNGTLVSTDYCTTTTTTTTSGCPAYGDFLYCDGTTGVFADGGCGEIMCTNYDGCGGSSGPCI